MPLYSYRCKCCGTFEAYHTLADYLAPTPCPRCAMVAEKVILHAPRVFGDYPGYISPATGKWVEGKKARERDMRESGCRPYEVGEMQDAVRHRQQENDRFDTEFEQCLDQVIGEMKSN